MKSDTSNEVGVSLLDPVEGLEAVVALGRDSLKDGPLEPVGHVGEGRDDDPDPDLAGLDELHHSLADLRPAERGRHRRPSKLQHQPRFLLGLCVLGECYYSGCTYIINK